ncbi:MAG: substrate-binding domain-containing protein [Opitutaceae bacterium]|jgi:LacI family transcriptional regulator|nr:substrate-binding domain-containing protein [Opitutaceae bacterium]
MKNKAPRRSFHMHLLNLETGWEYSRNIILGARHYAFTTGRIKLSNSPLKRGAELADMVREQHIDGMIVLVREKAAERKLLRLPVPCVNISNVMPSTRLPLVTQDDEAVGRLAAEHLLACGCTAFACWGQRNARFSQERIKGFRHTLHGRMPWAKCVVGEGPALLSEEGAPLIARMRAWLGKLPRRLGIFGVLDPFALHLIRAAQEIGRTVPEDIAIIGAGDDEFWVDFENVPLSSVKLPARQIGFEAAALLHKLMGGRKPAASARRTPGELHLPVTAVSARRSTDVLFVEDEAVARAVAFIREHASENVYVEDVVRASGISRSGLKVRFRQALGRPILSEIQRVRIARAQYFLRTTDMKLTAIAEACDFPSSPRLNVLFRQTTGQTPGEYRALFRHE